MIYYKLFPLIMKVRLPSSNLDKECYILRIEPI